MALRTKLNEFIRIYGQVSYNELKDKVENGYFGRKYRVSNMERRLRPSESPDIEEVRQNGYILAYKHRNPIKYREVAVKDFDGTTIKTIKLPI